MGRVKEWWMEQIEKVCNGYVADRISGVDANAAYDKAMKKLSDLHVSREDADNWLTAWSTLKAPS